MTLEKLMYHWSTISVYDYDVFICLVVYEGLDGV